VDAGEWFGGTAIRHTARSQEAPEVKDASVRPRGRRVWGWFALILGIGLSSPWPRAWAHLAVGSTVARWVMTAHDRRPPVRALAFASAGAELLAAGDGAVNVWSLPGAERARVLAVDAPVVNALAVSSDGKVVAAGGGTPGKSGLVQFWDWPAARPRPPVITRTDAVTAVAFRPDGRYLAAANVDGAVRVYGVDLGVLRYTVRGHRRTVRAVAFSPDSRVLATGGSDGAIKLWDAETGDALRTLTGHDADVRALCFRPRGGWLASGGADRTVRIWQYEAGRLVRTVRDLDGEALALAFRPDGARLLAATSTGVMQTIDPDSGAILRTRRLGHGEGRLSSLAFHPDGYTMAMGEAGGEAYLWDARTGRMIAVVADAAATR
jgi:WD40 repeat protein